MASKEANDLIIEAAQRENEFLAAKAAGVSRDERPTLREFRAYWRGIREYFNAVEGVPEGTATPETVSLTTGVQQ